VLPEERPAPGSGPADLAEALRRRFGDLLETAPDAMLLSDGEGRILLANRQAERLFRYPPGGLAERRVEDLVPSRFRGEHSRQRGSYMALPRVRPMGAGPELFALRADGSEFPVEISLATFAVEGWPVVSSAIRDATDRREASRLLEEARRRAEEGSRLKSAFLAGVSHEIRTPLNAILGFAELLHDGRVGPLTEAQRECLRDILASSTHLLQILNDLLDITKIEAGKVEIRPEPVRVSLLAAAVRDALRDAAASGGVSVALETDPEADEVVGDPVRLRQVLFNYLSNALKFTPPGGGVRVRTRSAGPARFRIEVEDTGSGIPAEDHGRIFGEF
jgi:protein-histidine pros-kinase